MNAKDLQAKIDNFNDIEDLKKNKSLHGEIIEFIQKQTYKIKNYNKTVDGSPKNIHTLRIRLPHDKKLLKESYDIISKHYDLLNNELRTIIEKDNAKLIPKEYPQDINTLESLFVNAENILKDKEQLKKIASKYIEEWNTNGETRL